MREELDWLGRSLGPLRDLDVLTERLRQETNAFDDEDRAAFANAFVALSAGHDAARANAMAALDSERYLALLDALAGAPPLLEAEKTLAQVAAREFRRLRKTMRDIGPHSPDELVHKARIRAKRLRYVAEVLGKKRVVRRAKQFQDVVGEHQDAVVAEQRLRELASRVPDAAVPLGRLIEREQTRRLRTRGDLANAWKRLSRAGSSAWV